MRAGDPGRMLAGGGVCAGVMTMRTLHVVLVVPAGWAWPGTSQAAIVDAVYADGYECHAFRDFDAAHAALDTTDGDAVARYNREIEGQHAIIARHDALLPEHNELVSRQSPRVDEFNAKCAGISYYRAKWLAVEVVPDPGLMPTATVF